MTDTVEEGSPLESQLLREIADIRQRIGALEQEQRALEAVLVRVRGRKLKKTDVTRRNSLTRIVVEDRVLEELADAIRPLSTERLHRAAREVAYSLKENTFRSILHRMKDRGQIVSPTRGRWLSNSASHEKHG